MTTWFLARFPRPIVASLIAIFRALVFSAILLALILVGMAVIASLFSVVYWGWVLTGGTVSSEISFIGLQLSCGGALSFPAGVFVYLAWHMLKEFDKDIPRREKKHD